MEINNDKKNISKKRINLAYSVLLKKHYKFLKNRETKLGKLPDEYIKEKTQNTTNNDIQLDGIIEFYKFSPKNKQENKNTQEDNKELFKNFEIKNSNDINSFLNFLKQQNFDKNYCFFINIDIPVKFIPLEFFDLFNINKLTIEDILSEDYYVKIDSFENYTYFSVVIPINENNPKNPNLSIIDKKNEFKNINDSYIKSLSFEQIHIILKDNILIIMQEGIKGDIFDIIRLKLNTPDSIIKQSIDYLLYYILDVVIDKFLIILENIEEDVYNLEQKVFNDNSLESNILINKIYNLKRITTLIRNFSLKMIEIIKALKNNYTDLKIINYYKDLKDHNNKLLDVIENLDHIFNNIFNLHISKLNYKQNDIMRILTVVNTIFVPIIFIASIYGMNFENMPELKWKYGYYFTLFIMLIVTILTLLYFKNKKIL
ncbi:MAG: hypothetical protein N2485_05350 [bacterium]|nr:hypothetical protein [bacterium]